jgi:hypothetical protein
MKEYNIIWIVIDSVRTYRSGVDDRDRLVMMDEFAKESIEFCNAITSAPSSILSASAMFTGLPANYISRHFNDWKFSNKEIDSVVGSLTERGYKNYSILNSFEERRCLHDLVRPLSYKYLPKGVSSTAWWTNKELTDILENVLKRTNNNEKAIYHLWYDCRKDPAVSDHVSRALELFKEYKIYDDSIIIINSDHGYPDASTGLTEEIMKNYSHDMIVTDDNIKVPLFIKYPGCPREKKIEQVVGTIDIFPTICDVLNLPEPNSKFKFVGTSLLPLVTDNIERSSRIIRTDTRLSMATGRITSLRSTKYKYTYNWDTGHEELFNLQIDRHETNNVLYENTGVNGKLVNEFRELKKEMEIEIDKFHTTELSNNFRINIQRKIKKRVLGKSVNILLIEKNAPISILSIFVDIIRKVFNVKQLDLLTNANSIKKESIGDLFENISEIGLYTDNDFFIKKYNYVFYLTERSKLVFTDNLIQEVVKRMKPERVFLIDYNFKLFEGLMSKWAWVLKRYLKRNLKFYRNEPKLIFYDIGLFLNYLKKQRRVDNPEELEKIMKMAQRASKI